MISARTSPSSGETSSSRLGVGLGRGDLEHRDDLAGAGELVGDEAMVRELDQFLDADARGPEDLDGRPAPEGAFFFEGKVASPAGGQVGDVDPARDRVPALQFLAVTSTTWPGAAGSAASSRARVALRSWSAVRTSAGRTGRRARVRWSMAALRCLRSLSIEHSLALIGHGIAASAHRDGILGGPLGNVEVERPDDQQLAAGGGPVADQPPVVVP